MAFTADGREVPRNPGGNEPLDLQLRIGDSLQVAFLSAERPENHEVRLLGCLPGRSLIVTAPERARQILPVSVGAAVAVRLFMDGHARGYDGAVLAVATAPYPHLHVTYPTRLDTLEERKTERVRAALAAMVVRAGAESSEQEIPAVMRDLSATGALVFTQAALGAKGERLTIRVRLPLDQLGDQAIELAAVIRTAAEAAELQGSLWRSRCGVEFETLSPQATLVLRAYLYERFAHG